MNDKLVEKIISVAYNDAGIFDRIYVNILAIRNREVKDILEEYRGTAREIHSVKEEEISEEKLGLIYAQTGVKSAGKSALLGDLFSLFAKKPMIASAMAFMVVALLVTTMFVKNRSDEVTYSEEEIINASVQTKQVFAEINKAFDNAKDLVREKVLKEHVAKPINESYKKVSKILNEGDIK